MSSSRTLQTVSDPKSGKSPTVIVVFSTKSSFVEKDLALLRAMGYQVVTIFSPPRKNLLSFALNRVREFAMILFRGLNARATISWFNDYHALLPIILSKVLKIPSLIIVGGYDAINYKNYHGLFSRKNIRQVIGRFNYKAADLIWVVHKSLQDGCPVTNQSGNNIESGILLFIPELKTPVKEVPTGYDSTFWTLSARKKSPTVLTVGIIRNEEVFRRKGIPLFIELAQLMPDYNFKIIGLSSKLREIVSIPRLDNLSIREPVGQDVLLNEYQDSSFYFQGSIIEGLPNVLCEAMLCGCIPIGRPIFGIPDAIGDAGHLIKNPKNLEPVVSFIRNANPDLGHRARERIIRKYPSDHRMSKFSSLLKLQQ